MQRTTTRRAGGLGRAEVPPLNESVAIPRALSDRVNALIQGIRPGRASEQRRHEIADYVRRLIVKCFQPEHKVEAFMFGSVPLRTYLPDGDIDVSIFCEARGLQDTWCDKLSAVLEGEAENADAEFKVANVSLINAEVKLLKCLVDNIVVDVSFNQIGGLCTLNFLEAMDRKIGGKHLFKKSIILIKAWCYYESRVLGAQHSLLSTYALETMVLHIFMVYHSELQTPLEVLYKFLIVFHHFQWDDYCLTLSGPVSLKDLDINAVPLTSEQGKTLLLPTFMNVMLEAYSYTPVIPANSKGPGYPKYMNIMDPLLHSNNLGRSVSKTSEIRIKNAFGHGARILNQLFKKEGQEAAEGLDQFFRNTWLAQQRPRLSPQLSRSQPYPTVEAKPGTTFLDLLKDASKEMLDHHDRENLAAFYQLPSYHAAPALATGGNLHAMFPPPPPRGPEDKAAVRSADLEKLSRQLHPAQHMRSLLEMQSMKSDASTVGAFGHGPVDVTHAFQQSLYGPYPPVKFLPQQNAAHLHSRRPESGLQRTRSEPNIGDLSTRKKEKNGSKYRAPFHVQLSKALPVLSQPMAEEERQKLREGPQQKTPSISLTARTPEAQGKAGVAKKTGFGSGRPELKLDDLVVEKLKVIEGRLKAAEKSSSSSPVESEGERESSVESPETEAAKDDQSSPQKLRPERPPLTARSDVHDQSVVIGEPPEPPPMEFPRVERDFSAASRSMGRQPGRLFDFHHPLIPPESRTSLIQLAAHSSPAQRQPMARMGLADRPVQTVMDLGPNGELLQPFAPIYPCFVNTGQYPQAHMYNVVHGELTPAPRGGAIPTRHAVVNKPDGRKALMDLAADPSQYPQWYRPDGCLVLDRRLNGGMRLAPQAAWTPLYSQVAAAAAGGGRVREDVALRDSDDVLSGDIETLTQHLEVARNFIGCKTSTPSTEKDRNSRSSSASHTPERPVPSAAARRGTPSPTMPNRTSSRERHPRNQLDSPSPFSHHPHVPPGAAVGYTGSFPAQPHNVLYTVPPTMVAQPPPPPGSMAHERLSNEGDLLAQLHAGANVVPAPGYNYPGPMRGMHVSVAHLANAGHPPGVVQHAALDPNLQLPPQPPRSASPVRGGKDAHVIRSTKAAGAPRQMGMEDHSQPISLPTDDGRTVKIDASVFQAVKAAMAEKASDDHQASQDPNNRTSPADPHCPRHLPDEAVHLRGGMHDPVRQHLTTRRQLEDGVVCYTGAKDFAAFSANRPVVGGEFPAAHASAGHLAQLFAMSAPSPASESRSEPWHGRMSGNVAFIAAPVSYGTGSFIPLNSHYAAEQRKAREQAEKEAQATEGTAEDDWSTRSGSNASEKTEQTESRGHQRGRFSPSNGQQWSTPGSSNRSYTQTPPRSYAAADRPSNAPSDSWQPKQDRPAIANGDLSEYYKDYGEVANAFVSSEAMTRTPKPVGGSLSYTNVQGMAQKYDEFSSSSGNSSYPSHRSSPGHKSHTSPNLPRHRADAWIPLPREKGNPDRSSTPDSIIRRANEPDRWESKRLGRGPNMSHRLDPLFKSMGNAEDDRISGRTLETLLNPARPTNCRPPIRHHRNRRSNPGEDRSRFPLKDTDFPALEAVRGPPTSEGNEK